MEGQYSWDRMREKLEEINEEIKLEKRWELVIATMRTEASEEWEKLNQDVYAILRCLA